MSVTHQFKTYLLAFLMLFFSAIGFAVDGRESLAFAPRPQPVLDNLGLLKMTAAEPTENLVTWVYEENTFVPAAKLVGDKRYSIVCDYLGTPIQSYNENGDLVWARELDIYGKTRKEKGETNFIPFHYQGQMYDAEVDLCYNRFRWYDQNTGLYISQDPIGLAGGNPTLYGYVEDTNGWIDIFGLKKKDGFPYVKISDSYLKELGIDAHTIKYDILGKKAKNAHYDLYKNTDTLDVVILEIRRKRYPN